MLMTRYNYIRERLILLYNVIQHESYSVWLAPRTMMDLEELRDRPVYTSEDTLPDTHYYDTPQLRNITVAQLTNYIPNMLHESELGFQQPNKDIVKLYEGIQEYIMLWCEVIKNIHELPFPPMPELRELESVAYILFKPYKEIKAYEDERDRNTLIENQASLARNGLGSLMGLFKTESIGYRGKGEAMSFISYVDELHTAMNWNQGSNNNILKSSDSLLASSSVGTTDMGGLGTWFMNQ